MIKALAYRAMRRVTIAPAVPLTALRSLGAGTWAEHEQVVPNRKFESAHVDMAVPNEDYYHGHLIADHLEYLDDMIEKAEELESNMEKLKATHEKKKQAFANVGWMESAEIESLFETSAEQKSKMQRQIMEIKQLLKSSRKTFAVDAPDGTTDLNEKEELAEVNKIIESSHDKEKVLKLRELDLANRKVIGVDSPDGISDDIQLNDVRVVNHIIEEAAQKEDREKIIRMHKMESAVQKDRARDPEHDW